MDDTAISTQEGGEANNTPSLDINNIHSATDAEIQSYLSEASNFEDSEPAQQEEPEAPTTDASDSQVVQQTEETASSGEQEGVANPPSVDQLQAELGKLQAKVQQQEDFIRRRNTELGQSRKERNEAKAQLVQLRQALEQGLDEKWSVNPKEAFADQATINQIDQRLQMEEQQDTILTRQEVVANHIQPGDVDINDMLVSLRSDGIPEEHVQAFSQNPYSMAQAETIIQLAKRAKAEKAVRELAGFVKALVDENTKLRQQGSNVVKKISNELNKTTPQVTATPQTGNGRAVAKPPHLMSSAEIEAFLEEHRGESLFQMLAIAFRRFLNGKNYIRNRRVRSP